ncbi:MAG: amylo-alpha-1,6-glucosidase, partial [Candidatus Omnitrophica bacterium]|nr:amylo-alpha-1,6-glucosidase [Candidatus Omnitrophota bacterium]
EHNPQDKAFLQEMLPTVRHILDHYMQPKEHATAIYYFDGELQSVYSDPEDGLVVSGLGAHWMDARKNITSRAGKTVEINALFYAALRFATVLEGQFGDAGHAVKYGERADLIQKNFAKKFWNPKHARSHEEEQDFNETPILDYNAGVPLDADKKQAAIRPNMLTVVSDAPDLLEPWQRKAVLDTVRLHLWTPYGIRTLSPLDDDFYGMYSDRQREARDKDNMDFKDNIYHQGPAWVWLIGLFYDAMKVVMEDEGRSAEEFRNVLRRELTPLTEYFLKKPDNIEVWDDTTPWVLNTFPEIFDSGYREVLVDEVGGRRRLKVMDMAQLIERSLNKQIPYPVRPGGTPSQNWSFAEFARLLVENGLIDPEYLDLPLGPVTPVHMDLRTSGRPRVRFKVNVPEGVDPETVRTEMAMSARPIQTWGEGWRAQRVTLSPRGRLDGTRLWLFEGALPEVERGGKYEMTAVAHFDDQGKTEHWTGRNERLEVTPQFTDEELYARDNIHAVRHQALFAGLREILRRGEIPLIALDKDYTLTGYGQSFGEEELELILATVEAGAHLAINSLTQKDVNGYRKMMDPLIHYFTKQGKRHLLARVHFVFGSGGRWETEQGGKEVFVYDLKNHAYQLINREDKDRPTTKATGLLRLRDYLNQRGRRVSILAAYGDSFFDAWHQTFPHPWNDGSVVDNAEIPIVINVGEDIGDAVILERAGGQKFINTHEWNTMATKKDLQELTRVMSSPEYQNLRPQGWESPEPVNVAPDSVSFQDWFWESQDPFQILPGHRARVVLRGQENNWAGFVWAWGPEGTWLCPLEWHEDIHQHMAEIPAGATNIRFCKTPVPNESVWIEGERHLVYARAETRQDQTRNAELGIRNEDRRFRNSQSAFSIQKSRSETRKPTGNIRADIATAQDLLRAARPVDRSEGVWLIAHYGPLALGPTAVSGDTLPEIVDQLLKTGGVPLVDLLWAIGEIGPAAVAASREILAMIENPPGDLEKKSAQKALVRISPIRTLDEMKAQNLARALIRSEGNIPKAGAALGFAEDGIRRMCKKFDVSTKPAETEMRLAWARAQLQNEPADLPVLTDDLLEKREALRALVFTRGNMKQAGNLLKAPRVVDRVVKSEPGIPVGRNMADATLNATRRVLRAVIDESFETKVQPFPWGTDAGRNLGLRDFPDEVQEKFRRAKEEKGSDLTSKERALILSRHLGWEDKYLALASGYYPNVFYSARTADQTVVAFAQTLGVSPYFLFEEKSKTEILRPGMPMDRIKWMIRARGLSQEAVAQKMGVSDSYVSAVLNTDGGLTRLTMTRFAEALGESAALIETGFEPEPAQLAVWEQLQQPSVQESRAGFERRRNIPDEEIAQFQGELEAALRRQGNFQEEWIAAISAREIGPRQRYPGLAARLLKADAVSLFYAVQYGLLPLEIVRKIWSGAPLSRGEWDEVARNLIKAYLELEEFFQAPAAPHMKPPEGYPSSGLIVSSWDLIGRLVNRARMLNLMNATPLSLGHLKSLIATGADPERRILAINDQVRKLSAKFREFSRELIQDYVWMHVDAQASLIQARSLKNEAAEFAARRWVRPEDTDGRVRAPEFYAHRLVIFRHEKAKTELGRVTGRIKTIYQIVHHNRKKSIAALRNIAVRIPDLRDYSLRDRFPPEIAASMDLLNRVAAWYEFQNPGFLGSLPENEDALDYVETISQIVEQTSAIVQDFDQRDELPADKDGLDEFFAEVARRIRLNRSETRKETQRTANSVERSVKGQVLNASRFTLNAGGVRSEMRIDSAEELKTRQELAAILEIAENELPLLRAFYEDLSQRERRVLLFYLQYFRVYRQWPRQGEVKTVLPDQGTNVGVYLGRIRKKMADYPQIKIPLRPQDDASAPRSGSGILREISGEKLAMLNDVIRGIPYPPQDVVSPKELRGRRGLSEAMERVIEAKVLGARGQQDPAMRVLQAVVRMNDFMRELPAFGYAHPRADAIRYQMRKWIREQTVIAGGTIERTWIDHERKAYLWRALPEVLEDQTGTGADITRSESRETYEQKKVRELIQQMGDSRAAYRDAAAVAMVIRGESVLPVLEQASKSKNRERRDNARWAIAKIREQMVREADKKEAEQSRSEMRKEREVAKAIPVDPVVGMLREDVFIDRDLGERRFGELNLGLTVVLLAENPRSVRRLLDALRLAGERLPANITIDQVLIAVPNEEARKNLAGFDAAAQMPGIAIKMVTSGESDYSDLFYRFQKVAAQKGSRVVAVLNEDVEYPAEHLEISLKSLLSLGAPSVIVSHLDPVDSVAEAQGQVVDFMFFTDSDFVKYRRKGKSWLDVVKPYIVATSRVYADTRVQSSIGDMAQTAIG